MNILQKLLPIMVIIVNYAWTMNCFKMVLHEDTTLNSVFDVLTNAGALNYGSYSSSEGAQYAVNVTNINLDIVNDYDHNLELSLSLSLFADLSYFNGIFSNSQNLTIDMDYLMVSEYNSTEKRISIYADLVHYDIEQIPDWFEDWLMYVEEVLDVIPIIELFNILPDLDEYYFSYPEVSFTNDAIIISIFLNDGLIVANKSIDNTSAYLGGTLSLFNLDIPELTHTNIVSPSVVLARLNSSYTATTNQISIGNETHWSWNTDNDFKLNTDEFTLEDRYFNEGLTSWFQEKKQVNCTSNINVQGIQMQDPWLVENPNSPPEEWIQPNNFTQFTIGQHSVFLNQNADFRPDIPIYRLRTPDVGDADGKEWYFRHWAGSNVSFQNPNSLTTAVVFLEENAEIEAIYKPHMFSSSATATRNSNSSNSAFRGNTWELAYVDNGEIFHTSSTNTGVNWNMESFLSHIFPDDNQHGNPSIAVDYSNSDISYVTYENTSINGTKSVRFVKRDASSWDEIDWDWGTTLNLLNVDMTPSAMTDPYGRWYVVFRGTERNDLQPDGIKLVTDFEENDVISIPETNSYSQKPSCVVYDCSPGVHKVNFFWEENSEIYSKSSEFTSSITWEPKESLSDVFPGAIYNHNPVSTTDGFDVLVAWESKDWIEIACPEYRFKTTSDLAIGCGYYVYPICIRKKTAGRWGPLTKIIHSTAATRNPALSAIRQSAAGSLEASLAYNCGSSVFTRTYSHDTWSGPVFAGTGYYPTVAYDGNVGRVAFTGGSSPWYKIMTFPTTLPIINEPVLPLPDETEYWRELTVDTETADFVRICKTSEFSPTGVIRLAMSETAVQKPDGFTPLRYAGINTNGHGSKENWFKTEPMQVNSNHNSITFNLTAYTYNYTYELPETEPGIPVVNFGLYSSGKEKTLLQDVYTLNFTDLPVSPDIMAAVVLPVIVDVRGLQGMSVYLEASFHDGDNDDAWQYSEVFLVPGEADSIKGHRSWVPADLDLLPEHYALSPNYPNPFNPMTTISYSLPELSTIQITIYDMLGRKVIELANDTKDGGDYQVVWNGKDRSGMPVSTGIYICKMSAVSKVNNERFTQNQKMLMIK